jgi:hypothetical protein
MRPVASCSEEATDILRSEATPQCSVLKKYRKSIVKNIVKMVFDEFVRDKDEGSKLSDLVPPPIILGLLP